MLNREFWTRQKVFLTGHTGFKGGWMATWLLEMGSEVSGYALQPTVEPSYFTLCGLRGRMRSTTGDVRDADCLARAVEEAQPSIVVHLAAQPLVQRGYRDPLGTLGTNVMGTANLLECVRRVPSVRAVIVVTTDKCYENREWVWGYREDDALGGEDPYSASKSCAELVARAYRRSFFECVDRPVGVAAVRAGNVIGGGDWGENRLVPDAVRAIQRGQTLMVRNPDAVRPWQHVLEPLGGYLMLAERLATGRGGAGSWNFGPGDEGEVTAGTLADRLMRAWGRGCWQSLPDPGAPRETRHLRLDTSKARRLLGWRPRLTLDAAVDLTVDWYREALSPRDADSLYALSREQIARFEAAEATRRTG